MASLVVMYGMPVDAVAFDAYYREKHIPLAKTIPGLRRYEINRGPVMTPAGPAKVHLIAILHFDDLTAIQNAFASPEGQAAAADLQLFATGGAEMLIFDSEDV